MLKRGVFTNEKKIELYFGFVIITKLHVGLKSVQNNTHIYHTVDAVCMNATCKVRCQSKQQRIYTAWGVSVLNVRLTCAEYAWQAIIHSIHTPVG